MFLSKVYWFYIFRKNFPIVFNLYKQWGNTETGDYDISPGLRRTYKFPISFPNRCFIAFPVLFGDWAGNVAWTNEMRNDLIIVKYEEWRSDRQHLHTGFVAMGI